MSDQDKQAAIDAILEDLDFDSVKELRAYVAKNKQDDYFYGGILHAINAVQDLSPEQPVARDTNVLSNDTISRQAAIDALYKMLHDCFWADDEELDAIIATLNDLPSAQPEPRWIPCSERLPEDGEQVLVQFINGQMSTIFFSVLGEKGHLTAWMPLPEPYKERTK